MTTTEDLTIEQVVTRAYDPKRSDADGTATLTGRDRAALRLVLGRMPYLPGAAGVTTYGFAGQDGPCVDGKTVATVSDVVTLLARLAPVLRDAGERSTRQGRELHDLRDDVAAVRRVLGVTS
jgi:hypothetical protein